MSGILNVTAINGTVQVALAPQADPAANVNISTNKGSIPVDLPDNCSARVDAGTANGRVNTSDQITISGDISTNSVKGTIGGGDGNLLLRSANGSIDIN